MILVVVINKKLILQVLQFITITFKELKVILIWIFGALSLD